MSACQPRLCREGLRTLITVKQGSANVLVVEDDYFVALETKEMLESAGYTVPVVAASGEHALASAAAHAPALALVDVSLVGNMDGIETALQLLKLGVRSIFATGHASQEIVERGEEANPIAWLFKPYTERELTRAVAEALDGQAE